MLGTKPGAFWIITWCLAAPLFLAVTNMIIERFYFFLIVFKGIVLSGLIQHISPDYGKLTDPYYYKV